MHPQSSLKLLWANFHNFLMNSGKFLADFPPPMTDSRYILYYMCEKLYRKKKRSLPEGHEGKNFLIYFFHQPQVPINFVYQPLFRPIFLN